MKHYIFDAAEKLFWNCRNAGDSWLQSIKIMEVFLSAYNYKLEDFKSSPVDRLQPNK